MMQNNGDRHSRNRKFIQHLYPDNFHSVEFKVNGLPYLFQFKIWKTQKKQMFILLKEPSDVLKRIKKGEIFDMKYYNSISKYPIPLKTKIDYIKKQKDGRFGNHFLAGLKILPDQNMPRERLSKCLR